METPYVGPYEVIARYDKYYVLQMGSRQDKVSIDRLKPAMVDQEGPVITAQPPKRGRPPRQLPDPTLLVDPGRKGPLDPQGAGEVPQDGRGQKPQEKRVQSQPSYAEVVSRSGRTIRPPQRYRN